MQNWYVRQFSANLHWLARQPWFGVLGRRLVPLDRMLQRLSGGRWSAVGAAGLRSVLLTTTGRRSGKQRHIPLLSVTDGYAHVVVGSNWGQRHHPAWTANLLADSRAMLTFRGEAIAVRAELVTGEGRDRLWRLITAAWPPYEDYERRAGRVLRVFRLVPQQHGTATTLTTSHQQGGPAS